MARVGIVGSGQAGCLLANGLLQAGHEVELWSDRTPEDWLDRARPTGTAVRFATSLAYERRLGLTQGHDEAPKMEGLRVTICSHPAKPLLTMSSRFATSPLAIDVRLQSARWMETFAKAGGRVEIRRATPDDIDALAARCDLTVVATGKEGGELFARDPARSPADRPLRRLAMVNCEGPAPRFADVPFAAAKFTILEGLGECYWTPWWHKDGKAVWNLVFATPSPAPSRATASCRSATRTWPSTRWARRAPTWGTASR